jgi:hypothetical protein
VIIASSWPLGVRSENQPDKDIPHVASPIVKNITDLQPLGPR